MVTSGRVNLVSIGARGPAKAVDRKEAMARHLVIMVIESTVA
jgi:hypothetical protein